MPELLDIYDDNLNHIGVKPRSAVHREGDWHRVFHCWVIYRDSAGRDYVIFQMRGANKTIMPRKLDISAAGHYESGETPSDGVRELSEELGLSPAFESLIPVGRRVKMMQYDDLIDREIADVFFYICDQPLRDYTYERDEVDGLMALDVLSGVQLFSGDVDRLTVPAVGVGDELTVTVDDFVPVYDHYWAKVCLLATRCLNGDDYLYI